MLVLLNGPPASGESTISARLVDRRPLALNLDIDVVRGHLGRWMDDPNAAGIVARALAIAMAKAHLVGGYDVFVPQFLGRPEFIDELSLLALDVGARFVEIALMIDRDLAQDAFDERSATARDQTHGDAAALVERSQADNAIGEMFDRYVALLEQRPLSRRIEVTRGNIEGTSREHRGNIEGTSREHRGNIDETVRRVEQELTAQQH